MLFSTISCADVDDLKLCVVKEFEWSEFGAVPKHVRRDLEAVPAGFMC